MISINKNECAGCGICENICPEGIEMVNGIAKIKNENAACLKDAANSCPRNCIIFEGDESEESKNINQKNFNQRAEQGRGMGTGPRNGSGIGRGSNGRGQGRGMGQGRRS